MNTSAGSGYLQPTTTQGLPRGLSLAQFIQTVLVGVSALPGTFVRPNWQIDPPKQPDIGVDWMSFGITHFKSDTYAYVGVRPDGSNDFQRQEKLQVLCSIYGPNAEEIYGLIRDGLQLSQNLEVLKSANMGFTSLDEGLHVPDLINERFFDRIVTTLHLNRQIQRTYPILPILSAKGSIHSVVGSEEYLLAWKT